MESGYQADVQEHGSRVEAQSLILILEYGFASLASWVVLNVNIDTLILALVK